MNRPCCTIWREMGKLFQDKERSNLQEIIETSKMPSFVFAPTFAFLDNMLNHCPDCGLKRGGVATTNNNAQEVTTEEIVPEQTRQPVKIKYCRACAGTGFVDKTKTTNCMQCLGKGKFTNDHVGVSNNNYENKTHSEVSQIATDIRSADDGFKDIGTVTGKLEE